MRASRLALSRSISCFMASLFRLASRSAWISLLFSLRVPRALATMEAHGLVVVVVESGVLALLLLWEASFLARTD